jgi:glutamate-1-semialdehyde aminotransferase
VAQGICELTGHDRAALCNTGSEAVMGVMRIARTVTGRSLIAIMSGSYHGIFDEVIVRGTKTLKSVPASPGILPEAVKNVIVLDYGTPETLEILRSRAHELAAIMIEPVQSRRPDFQPREFIQALRGICDTGGCALIMDEVITGFRLARGGAQEHFGVKADLCSYGKVIGGGQPIGVMAGKRAWMDALDGGHWQYGDASVPTVGVTYFAGTFVRHPIALAAAQAVIDEMKAKPNLQQTLNARTEAMAGQTNTFFNEVGVPLKMKHFGSLWKLIYTDDQTHGDLLFCFMRDRGVHIWDGFPCFLTVSHSEADVALLLKVIRESVTEMQEAGFLPGTPKTTAALPVFDSNQPPVPGARLGRDPSGNPAWFVPNPNEPGKFLKLN